ncbi:MAG TPA: HAD family hydrolase [Accumulibacter sp.]|nr:HAD family hydrolase [Accumulibacter sp.]
MNSQITDVIFDLDGTLIDSAPSILACFAETLAAQGIAPVLPLTDALIGPPLRDTLRRLSGVEEAGRLEIMIENFKERYDFSGYKATVVFSGVDEMLRELRDAGMRLHIATNKRLRPTRLILSHLGWTDLFGAVYALDFRTPSFRSKSEMLSELVQAEGITRSRAVYVGDRRDDRTAAADNALGFIAAAWGYRDEEMLIGNEQAISAENPTRIHQMLACNFPS